jgi:hypothetical protein
MVMGYAARYRMQGKEARRKRTNIEQKIAEQGMLKYCSLFNNDRMRFSFLTLN